jgi:SPX domain protein involved in polyphosphate accumulation
MTLLSAEEKKLDAELSLLSGLLNSFIQQHVEGEMEMKKSAGIKVDLKEVKQEMEEVVTVKESKAKIANEAAHELEEAKALYEKASVAAKELEAIKAENDKADTTVLQPALTRKAEASKEKVRLVGEVSELHKVMAEQQKKINEAVAGTDAKTSVMSGGKMIFCYSHWNA